MCEHYFVEAVATKLDYEKSDNGRIETVVRRKVCCKCYKTKTEIELEQQLAALIEQQAQEIERMKCCGNCKYFGIAWAYEETKCYAGHWTQGVEITSKCDQWQQVKEGQ